LVKTIADLPEDFAQSIRVTINDRDFGVVSRNVILLLFAFTSLDNGQPMPDIAENLIHIWYSAFLPADLIASLQRKVLPLIRSVCSGITGKTSDTVHKKKWTVQFGATLRLSLRKHEWLQLEQCLNNSQGLGLEEAKNIRAAKVLAPERLDYRERWYNKDTTPSMRLAKQQFREDGLLLPFGYPRVAIKSPNLSVGTFSSQAFI
jgi:hypothetical protein